MFQCKLLFVLITVVLPTIAYPDSKITQKHIDMLKNEKPEIRAKAIEEIVKTNDKSVVFYLIEALKDKNKIVVKKAIIWLSERGDSSALKPLMDISMQFKDQELQQLALKAVKEITSRISVQEGFSDIEKESLHNKFFRISSGYHKEILSSLNNELMAKFTGNSAYTSEEKNFSGDAVPIRFDFGYRFGSSAGIGGIGYVPKQTINTKWSDGTKGEITLDSYFFEFNYRQYLIGDFESGNLIKKVFPYISGGLGLYFVNWKVNDKKIGFNLETTTVFNPEAFGNQIGLNISAGIEYFLYKIVSLDVQGGYLYARISQIGWYDKSLNATIIILDSSKKTLDVDLSGVYFLIGINFYIL